MIELESNEIHNYLQMILNTFEELIQKLAQAEALQAQQKKRI